MMLAQHGRRCHPKLLFNAARNTLNPVAATRDDNEMWCATRAALALTSLPADAVMHGAFANLGRDAAVTARMVVESAQSGGRSRGNRRSSVPTEECQR